MFPPVNAGFVSARFICIFRTRVLSLESLLQPASESAEEAVGAIAMRATWARLVLRDSPRIGDQAGGNREGGTAGRLGQARDANRPTHAHLLVEDELRELAHTRELARAAGQHD